MSKRTLNGRANCIFAVCCDPGSPDQIAALVDEILEARILPADVGGRVYTAAEHEAMAGAFAGWLVANVDLAPLGSLVGFKGEIKRLAREPHRGGNKGDAGDASAIV